MYTKYFAGRSAEEIVEFIAKTGLELSQDKVRFQRDDWYRICKQWCKENPIEVVPTFTEDF